MVKRRVEPLLWLLFSSGGLAAALLLPVLLLFGLVFPQAGVSAPDQAHLLAVARNPLTRIVLLGLCVLALFHWAHMFCPLHALLRTPAQAPQHTYHSRLLRQRAGGLGHGGLRPADRL